LRFNVQEEIIIVSNSKREKIIIIFHAEPSAMGCEEAKGAKFIRISIDKIAGIKS